MNIPRLFGRDKYALRQAQEAWLSDSFDPNWIEPFDTWVNEGRGRSASGYVDEWVSRCIKKPTTIQISRAHGVFERVIERLPDVDKFGIALDSNSRPFKAVGKLIDVFRSTGNGEIDFENCAIRDLQFHSNAHNVILKNCRIGTLNLGENSLATFKMIGGSVRRVRAPTPANQSPFCGSVEIRDVKLSPAFENAQAYRNLRHHLTTLHNHEAASIFHAAEMQSEVQRQSLVDRFVSLVYRALSNYGGSSARPLAVFLLFLLANFLFLFFSDGAITLGDVHEAEGWRYDLYGLDEKARLLRSIVFATSQCFNPLGVFGTRLLLSGRTPLIALISGLLGIASTLSLTLFVLAIRRRFRLDRTG